MCLLSLSNWYIRSVISSSSSSSSSFFANVSMCNNERIECVSFFYILNYCSIVSPLNACVCTFQFASTNITHECELIQFHIIIPYSYKWNLNTRFIDMFAVWEMMIELYQDTLLPPVNVRTQTDWQFPFIPFWINQVLCHMTIIDDVIFLLFVLSNPINGYD